MLFRVHSEEGGYRTIACSKRGVARSPRRTDDVLVSSRPNLEPFRAEFEGEEVKAFAYSGDVTIGLMRV